MAQKIIGIKIEVDAEQGKKLGLVFQQAEKSAEGLTDKTKELQRIEAERASLLDKQTQAYSKLTGVIDKANAAIANNARGANLGIYAANAALQGYQNTLTQTTAKLEQLGRKQQELSLTKRSFISGISEADLRTEEKRLEVQRKQEEIARIMSAAYREQVAQINKAEQAEAKRLATLKSAVYYGMKEQTGYTPSKAPAQNYSYATGAYKDKEAEYKAYMRSMEEAAYAENEKYKKGLEAKKFADTAYVNARKVMYAQMFDEIAAKEDAAARRAKPVDARSIASQAQNPYATYNTATGAKSFKPDTTYDVQAEAAKLKAIVDYENAIRDAGHNKALLQRTKYAKDVIDIEQKLAKDIETIRQKVAGGFLTKDQGFEAQRKAVEEYGKALRSLPSMNAHIAEHKNLFIHIGEIIGAYRILNFVINSVSNAISSIPKIGIELESTVASLTATMGAFETGGSSAGMVAAMRALNEEASRTGINIATLRENFRGFQASTSLAGESLQSTWNIFTNLNTTITGLHLSADKAKGIFNALAQIFNKNKVQSEELVKQLGNLLPGAFASFAKANEHLFGSSQDLIAQMRKGTVFAHETVENFANFLAQRFAPAFALAQQGLNANIGRMQTSFTALGEAIYGVSSGPMLAFVKGVTSINESLVEAIKGTTEYGKTLNSIFSAAFNATLSATAGYLVVIASRSERLIALARGMGAFASSIVGVGGAAIGAATAANVLKASLAFLSTPVAITTGLVTAITAIGLTFNDAAKEAEEAKNKVSKALDVIRAKIETTAIKPINIQVDEDATVKATDEAIKIQEKAVAKYKALADEGVKSTTVAGRWVKVKEQLDLESAKLNELQEGYKAARIEAERSIKINIDGTEAIDRLDKIRDKARELQLEASGDKVGLAAFRFDKANLDSIKTLEAEVENAKAKVEEWQRIAAVPLLGAGVDENELRKWEEATTGLDRYKKNLEALEQYKAAKENTISNAASKEVDSYETEVAKADRLFKQQQDQASKILEAEKQNIAQRAEREQLSLAKKLDDIQASYDAEKISLNEFISQKATIEQASKEASLRAIEEEIQAVQKKIAVYETVPQAMQEAAQEARKAQAFLDDMYAAQTGIGVNANEFSSENAKDQAINGSIEIVSKYNAMLEQSKTRLDEIAKARVEISQLETKSLQVQNQASAAINENAKVSKQANTEMQNSLAITNQAYLEQLGIINEISIREAINAKYAAEVARLSAIKSPDINYGAAQERLAQIAGQKEYEVGTKLSEMRQKQEDELRSISKAYQQVGFSASDALNLQLQGFGQLITAMDDYGRRQQEYANKQLDYARQQEEIGNKINAIGSSIGPEGATDAQLAALNKLNDQYTEYSKARQKAQVQETAEKIGDIRKIAGVSKSFFAENTKARQTLHNVEMTLGAVETATKLASLAIDGAKAILTQGQGDPYTAFARIAAMAALVAGIIAGVGGAMTKTGTVNNAMPLSDAKGTTFGAPEQDATDLQDTLSFLSDVNYKSYRELRKLNENFSGISDDIYRLTLLSASGKILNPLTVKEGKVSNVPNLGKMTNPDPVLAGLFKVINSDPITKFLLKGIFGTTTTKVIDSGIQTLAIRIQDVVKGTEVFVQQFTTVEESKKSWFGSSKKIYDIVSSANKEATTVFTSLYRNMAKSIIDLASQLTDVEVYKAFRYQIPALKVSFNNQNAEEIQKTLQGVVSKQLNLMAKKVFSVFLDLRQLKEGMFSTVSRVFAEREIVSKLFQDIGVTSLPTANIEAIKFSDAMIQLSSSTGTAAEKLKAFVQAENDFYRNFVSKNQQNLDVVENVAEGLFGVFEKGLSSGQGKLSRAVAAQQAIVDSFAKVYERTKITDNGSPEIIDAEKAKLDAEQARLGVLKAQSPKGLKDYFQEVFASTGDFGAALIEIKRQLDLDTVAGKETYTMLNDLNDLTEKYNGLLQDIQKPITDQITSLQDSIDLRSKDQLLAALAASKDINEQKALATKIQKLMLDKHNAEVNSIKTITAAYKQLGELVKSLLLGDLSTLGPKAKLDEARTQYESTLATAQGPDKVLAAEAAQKLGSIAQAYLQQAKTYYSSTTAYADIFKSVTTTLQALADSVPDTSTETSVSQAVIDSTKATVDQLKLLQDTVTFALSETLKVKIVDTETKVEAEKPKTVGTLEGLFAKLAASSGADRKLINKQIDAYNAGFKKSGSEGAGLALAAEQERQAAQASLKAKETAYKAAKKSKDSVQMALLTTDIATAKATIAAKTAILKSIGFKASGGDAYGPTVVGERGMEFVNLPRGTHVSSNTQTNSIIALANKQVIAELQGMNKELRSLNDRMGDIERKARLSKSERTLV